MSSPESLASEGTTDLRKRRDDFVQTFFKRGAEITSELLEENEKLRKRLADADESNARLRAQIASEDAIRDLLTKIAALEDEKERLLSTTTAAEAASRRFASRFGAVEEELSMLANVYVASYQLNSTLSLDSVFRHIDELLGQLIGSRAHAIFLASDAGRRLLCVAGEVPGYREGRAVIVDDLPSGDRIGTCIERVFLTGESYVAEDPHSASAESLVACLPLRVADQLVGAIAIASVLHQKTVFLPVDFELFKILSAHAATALFGAQLYEQAGRILPSPDALLSQRSRR